MKYLDFLFLQFACISKKSSILLLHLEYYSDILFLDSPKVIKTSVNSNMLLNVNDIVKDVSDNKNVNLTKFDKKNRVFLTSYDQANSKSKKNKIKVSKAKRENSNEVVKKVVSAKEDLFAADISVRSGLKSRKINQKSKKNKFRTSSDNLSISEHSVSHVDFYDDQSNQLIFSKEICLDHALSIQELSSKIQIPTAEIITYLFLKKSVSVTINDTLDFNICSDVVKHYGFIVNSSNSSNILSDRYMSLDQNSSMLTSRPPIITVLGHVDHGKTTLLSSIIKKNLAVNEQGGITQSITGYEIIHEYKATQHNLVFIDTPGHESFELMRLRGAKITDIVLLIVALDDGLKPQTLECIKYIKIMSLSCIIVVTKFDKNSKNLDKIKQDLADQNLLCEQWGGSFPLIEVSALTGYNINQLLSKICELAISKKILANHKDFASGIIIDAFLDVKKGSIATLIVKNGTLKLGDVIVADDLVGRVKSITNHIGSRIDKCGPSSIVNVLCFSEMPRVGSTFNIFSNEKKAKQHSVNYLHSEDKSNFLSQLNKRVSLNNRVSSKDFKLIIKCDTQGSLEAIINLLSSISQVKVQISIISASSGNITNSDIELAFTTNAYIVAFNVKTLPQIDVLIKKYNINLRVFNIIYDLLEYVQNSMLNLVDPEYDNILTGHAIVQTIFKTNKGFVAGCTVTSGKISLNSYLYIYRKKILVYKGYVTSLKYMKNDVQEVVSPSECGLMSDFYDWQQSDLIEAYNVVAKEKVL
uniref:Translation initiation factor IF-2, chloroplastic n=1 Tax=Tolypiocladia glomerulata TaxID=860646 RepID=A0A1Z1MVC7_9FLOR|nr:translation initiation factor 2 [Tolypiocladia glomerulata]ARW69745.1 translation initiation factor 2 [Tolypiocladia glomerulata]